MSNQQKLVAGILFVLSITNACSSTGEEGRLAAMNLRCEYRTTPLGIDCVRPRLSWVLESADPDARDQRQSAYQILVATEERILDENRGDVWDTGKVESSESLQVEYRGRDLVSGQRAYWKVRVWDEQGLPSEYSAPSWWEMGLLSLNDWAGRWISSPESLPATDRELFGDLPSPLFRKDFLAAKPIRRARAYVSGLGYYELRLNGERVGDHLLDPGWTAYGKRVLYSTYDVTSALKNGANTVGLLLGNGWYNPLPLKMWGRYNIREHLAVGAPRAILTMIVEYEDGTRTSIGTDESWKTDKGPILRNSVYLGETHDARREQPGWDAPGFDDSAWNNAVAATGAVGALCAQAAPPIRVIRTLSAKQVSEPKSGVFVVDLGENFAGVVRLKVEGPAGTRVSMRYGELLFPDGMVNGLTSCCGQIKRGEEPDAEGAPGTAWQRDEYILKGQGIETYVPRFTFHGFRYVELTGFPGSPTADTIEGLALSSAVESAGSFTCSNELFNTMNQITRRTLLSNLFSVQSDCPHREKFGYGGDIVASSDMAMLNFDMATLYSKVTHDMADAVRPNGGFTETSPYVGIADAGLGEGSGPIGWGTAHPLLQWQLYQYYGEKRLLEDEWERTTRWMALLDSNAKDLILDNGIGDHESLVPKSTAVSGTAFYYYNNILAARIADVLGHKIEAEQYRKKAEAIRDAFNSRFLKEGRVDIATQACQAFALYMGMAPNNERQRVLDVLVDDVVNAQKGHLTTGIFGTKYMLMALSDLGRADVAWQIANQKTFPGWGHMIEQGATTLWEHWEFSDNTFSHNHPMFGSVSEWFYRVLAGINPAPDADGFDKIVIQPRPVGDTAWVEAEYDSVRGPVCVKWKRENNLFLMNVSIPVGVEAAVMLPCGAVADVTESGEPLSEQKGLSITTDNPPAVRLGSGTYQFECPLQTNAK